MDKSCETVINYKSSCSLYEIGIVLSIPNSLERLFVYLFTKLPMFEELSRAERDLIHYIPEMFSKCPAENPKIAYLGF
jgi:hypothetical protein